MIPAATSVMVAISFQSRCLDSDVNSSLLSFLVGFVRSPTKVGTLLPSSRWVVARLMRAIDFQQARCIVEFGPGTGVITDALLKQMAPDARLLVIETEAGYVKHLREQLGEHDPRLIVEHGSAADLSAVLKRHELSGADLVVSGIPFSTLPDTVREDILAATAKALGENGRLLVYQYTQAVVPYLKRYFSIDSRAVEWRNLMPMLLFSCSPRRCPEPASAAGLTSGSSGELAETD